MGLGLKRTTVALEEHNDMWEHIASQTISLLKRILGDVAVDIQHVGSTAIRGIVAKPIIDIAVGVRDFYQIQSLNRELAEQGILYRKQDVAGQLLYVIGDSEKEFRTHHIHVVIYGSDDWNRYLNFCDYLNFDKDMAKEYSELKKTLAILHGDNRGLYTQGKHDFIERILAMASEWRCTQNETNTTDIL